MKASTLLTSLIALASMAVAQYSGKGSPACHGSDTADCGCCVAWSYFENACVQAQQGKFREAYTPCHSLFTPPIGSAKGPDGCGIWLMDKKKCEEWLDGYEDGFTQPDSGPDGQQRSMATMYGTKYAPNPTGPLLTVQGGSTKVVTSTLVVFVTRVAKPTSVTGVGEQYVVEVPTSTSTRMKVVTVTA